MKEIQNEKKIQNEDNRGIKMNLQIFTTPRAKSKTFKIKICACTCMINGERKSKMCEQCKQT